MKTETYPDRETWLEARRGGIGGSDAAATVPVSLWPEYEKRWSGPLALYADKTAPRERDEQTLPQEMGHFLEPKLAELYTRETGYTLDDPGDFTIVRHAENDWQTDTLDRMIRSAANGDGVLQLKSHSAFQADAWGERPPLCYQVQIQHEMHVTGCTWGVLAVLIGNHDYRSYEIERDDSFIVEMTEWERSFWFEHVVPRVEPTDVDGSDATRKALMRLHPDDNGETVALPTKLAPVAQRFLELSAELSATNDEHELRKNQLIAAIGAATFATVGGVMFSLKTQTCKAYEAKESKFRVLRKVKP